MKTFFLYLLFILSFNACFLFSQHVPTIKEKEEAFSTLAFDKKIIADFTKYNDLAQILLTNLDTIINYKNSRNYVTVSNGNGKQSKQLWKEDCFMFLNGNDFYDIKKIPSNLSLTADSLWVLVDKPQLQICSEKRPASFVVKKIFKKRENRILECHFLYWKLSSFDNNDSFDLVKDTVLSKDCVYRIGITTDNSGW